MTQRFTLPLLPPRFWSCRPAPRFACRHAGAHQKTGVGASRHVQGRAGHTQVLFSVDHMGFTYFSGNFSGASGSLTLTPKNPATMSVSVSVPTASVSTTVPKLTEELNEADWLDTAKYPTMVFRSTSVTLTGDGKADIAGMLSLHGVTTPLTLHATCVGAGVNILSKHETVGFQLSGSLRRSDFGVANYVPLIGDEVTITINAAFEK